MQNLLSMFLQVFKSYTTAKKYNHAIDIQLK